LTNDKNRRLLSLLLIFVVLIVSVVLIVATRAPSGQVFMKAVSDGSGGTIVAWCKKHSIHMQRVDSNGVLLWDDDAVLNGVKVEQASQFDLVGDGQGGVIIMWGDVYKLPDDYDDPAYFSPAPVYGQRLDHNGEPLWCERVKLGYAEHHGVALSLPQIVPCGDGGVITVWNDYNVVFRALKDDNYRIQKISATGEQVWGDNGVLICSSDPYRKVTPADIAQGIHGTWIRSGKECGGVYAVGDGAGGAIVAWSVHDNNNTGWIYAQRYYPDAGVAWEEAAVLLGNGMNLYLHSIISDGVGGAMILMNSGLYTVQRIDNNGRLLWPDNGIPMNNGVSRMVSDGAEGFLFVWIETLPSYGQGAVFTGQNVLHVQRVNGEGKTMWADEALFTGGKGYMVGATLIDDGSGGAFVAWQVWKQGSWDKNVYIQKVNANGKPEWYENGKAIFPASFQYQGEPVLVGDDNGGVIILAIVGKSPINGDIIYAQRADASGDFLWQDGINVSRGQGGK
jgi:hypothetical protein